MSLRHSRGLASLTRRSGFTPLEKPSRDVSIGSNPLSARSRNSLTGFTLIELLVVIAIIGILSAVVLASLNTARTKGSDASVKANLGSVATQAALFLSNNNNVYGVFDNGAGAPAACPVPGTSGATVFHDPTIENAIASALVSSSGGTASCASSNSAYAVAVTRPADVASTTSVYWCADSTGVRCGIDTAISGPVCGACATTQ